MPASLTLLLALAGCQSSNASNVPPADDDAGSSPREAGEAGEGGAIAPSSDAATDADAGAADAQPASDGAPPTLDAGPGASNIRSGGTSSVNGVFGMHDLAVAANTAMYRAKGGELYIHEVGWVNTSAADKKAIVSLFPNAPIYETGQPQLASALKNLVMPYWPGGAYVTCVNVSINKGVGVASVADMQAMRAESLGMTRFVGQYYSPNDTTSFMTPFADPKWDDLRTGAMIGGALCIDSPPQYYLLRPAAYQQWTADEVAWATSHGVVVVFALFPRTSVDFTSDTMKLIADQKTRGAAPTIWAVNGYYSSESSAVHPIGSETDPNDSMSTALKLLLNGD